MGHVSRFSTVLFAALAILLVLVGVNGSPTAGARLARLLGNSEGSIIFIPLDERYATRGLWLNLVRLAKNKYRRADSAFRTYQSPQAASKL